MSDRKGKSGNFEAAFVAATNICPKCEKEFEWASIAAKFNENSTLFVHWGICEDCKFVIFPNTITHLNVYP